MEKRDTERKRDLWRLKHCRVMLYRTSVLQMRGKMSPAVALEAHLLLSGPTAALSYSTLLCTRLGGVAQKAITR